MTDEPQKRSWWSRNWKWFVPAGCLAICILFIGFLALIISLAFGLIKSSDAYKDALAKAKANPAVVKALGEPIGEGFLVGGNINVNGASGQADLAIPISGPKGKATLYAVASKSAGQWTFSQLIVEVGETKERIDLLNAQNIAAPEK